MLMIRAFVIFSGNSLGFAYGRQWNKLKKGFKASLSPTTAESSLTSIEDTLAQWDKNILKPLAESGKAIRLQELVGLLPITTMLNIFFGQIFIERFSNQINQFVKDASFILETAIHNKWAASPIYKYFDTEANR